MIYLFDDISIYKQADLECDLASLSVAHQQKIMTYRSINRQKMSMIGLKLLLYGLKNEYGFTNIPNWKFEKHGKPYFDSYIHIHFNISHCPCAVACALDSTSVGIDVQDIARANKPLVWQRVCSNKERDALAKSNDPPRLFARFWSLKESYVKYTGEGIGQDLKKLDFHDCIHSTQKKRGLFFTVLEYENYVLSVCSMHPNLSIQKLCIDEMRN